MGLFELTMQSRLAYTACEATEWVSMTSVRCRTPRSMMTTLKFAITMGTNAGSMTEGMSFHSAEVDVMTPTNGTNQTMLNPTNEATTGSVSLTVFGVGLGTVDRTEHLPSVVAPNPDSVHAPLSLFRAALL